MSIQLPETETSVLQQVQRQANQLRALLEARTAPCCWQIDPGPATDMRGYGQPENIDSGASGMILLYIELYRRTGDHDCLAFIDEAIERLLAWCQAHPTAHYALYTGRAGVVYVLIQRYFIDRDDRFLQAGLELMRPCNGYYLASQYTSNYLYDGRAGTLLVLLHLYQLTGADWLPAYITSFTDKILLQACLCDEGIYWMPDDELNCRPSCAFAFGAAGIQYVLQQVDTAGTCEAIQYVIQQTARFSHWCRQEQGEEGWGDASRSVDSKEKLDHFRARYQQQDPTLFTIRNDDSWGYGTSGVLQAVAATATTHAAALVDPLINRLLTSTANASGLLQGWSGCALSIHNSLLPYSNQAGRSALLNALYDRLQAQQPVSTAGGLMQGDAGVLYCLLQTLDPRPLQACILLPLAPDQNDRPVCPLSAISTKGIVLTEALSHLFPRTINLLRLVAPRVLKAFIDAMNPGQAGQEVSHFVDFMQSQWAGKAFTPLTERLADLFTLELKKLRFYQTGRSTFHRFLHRMAHNEKILASLNGSENWQLNKQISVSPHIQTVLTKWNWSLHIESEAADYNSMLKKHIQNMAVPPAEFEYVFSVAGRFGDIESCFETAYRALLHRFDQPKTLAQAIAEIKYYIDTLSNAAKEQLLEEIGVLEDARSSSFIGSDQSLVMSKLKSWLHRDILSFQNTLPVQG